MKLETYEIIFKNSFAVNVNMNDVFGYACADEAEIDVEDLKAMENLIDKYGNDIFIAYESIKRGYDPIPELITSNYASAKTELSQLIQISGKYDFYELKKELIK